jgi:lipopolysaccharide transport system ATP-binding protein
LPTSSEAGGQLAIRCEGIGKRYRIGKRERYRTLRDSIAEMAAAPFRRLRSPGNSAAKPVEENPEIWALTDISFEVRQGEILGVIGRNGSGKSTLLKILSRITRPTRGRAELRGRVGSLLEVGAGFHPELTGRANIYLNGAVLGMSRREIDRKFDEIVEFAECGRMLDTPIKRYSSGMYVRLAFAVAAHMETEILLVDEVLAVGDAAFQKKCLGKIGDTAHQGRTVLFVSHNLLAVDSLCTRAICLHDGKLVLEGPPGAVTSKYLKEWLPTFKEVMYDDIATAPGNDVVRLRGARVRTQDNTPNDWLTVRTPLLIEIEYWKLAEHTMLDLVAQIFNEHGIIVFTTAELRKISAPRGLLRSAFSIPADLLNSGTYKIQMLIFQGGIGNSDVGDWDNLLTFEIHDVASDLRGDYHGHWPGAVRPHLEWNTHLVEPLAGSAEDEPGPR